MEILSLNGSTDEVITGNIFPEMQSDNAERCKDLFARLCIFHKLVPICWATKPETFNHAKWTATMSYDDAEIKQFQQQFIKDIDEHELSYRISDDFCLYTRTFITETGETAHDAMFHLLERYRLVYESIAQYNHNSAFRKSWAIHGDYPYFQQMLEEHYTKSMIKFDTLDVLELELAIRGF